jgi:putative AlgH/UPF0301 family transcriptional regulator
MKSLPPVVAALLLSIIKHSPDGSFGLIIGLEQQANLQQLE